MNLRITSTLAISLRLFPSVVTECVDDPAGWGDGASGPGYTCLTYALGNWCTAGGGEGSGWDRNNAFGWGNIHSNYFRGTDGKMYDEACCACGGGIGEGFDAPEYDHVDYVFTEEDKAKAPNRAKRKIVPGEHWVDAYGYSCRAYKAMNMCNPDGTQGDGWDGPPPSPSASPSAETVESGRTKASKKSKLSKTKASKRGTAKAKESNEFEANPFS